MVEYGYGVKALNWVIFLEDRDMHQKQDWFTVLAVSEIDGEGRGLYFVLVGCSLPATRLKLLHL
jgi:hypothetical protein